MHLRSLAAAALAAAMITAPAAAQQPVSKAETRLAKALEGRVAGEPVRCLNLRRIQSSQIYDKTAIVYKVGSTLYVNRPDAGENSLRRNDIMVIRTSLSQLCDIDTVEMRDSSGFYSGVVFLGEFVPYERAADAAA